MASAVFPAASLPVAAQTTVSVNLDYAEGKYGDPEKSTTWTMPLIIKHQAGALGLKVYIPYVRASGTAVSGGDRSTPVKQIQEGLGDVVATAVYEVYGDPVRQLYIDAGTKVKFATADKSKDLLTTGRNDYSLLVEARKPVADVLFFGTLGHTKKGDPTDSDFRDPWFSTLGFNHKLSDRSAWGALYDYRQKITRRGDPISEASLFLEHKLQGPYRLQVYLLRGFSDASPDWGLGTTLSMRF